MSRTIKVKRMFATIKKLKREIKSYLKSIENLESSRSDIVNAWAKEVQDIKANESLKYERMKSSLSKTIDLLQKDLAESQRRKWYQFIPEK